MEWRVLSVKFWTSGTKNIDCPKNLHENNKRIAVDSRLLEYDKCVVSGKHFKIRKGTQALLNSVKAGKYRFARSILDIV